MRDLETAERTIKSLQDAMAGDDRRLADELISARQELRQLHEALRQASGSGTRADDPGHVYVRFPKEAWDALSG